MSSQSSSNRFIGGAERARRNAQKTQRQRKGTKIQIPGSNDHNGSATGTSQRIPSERLPNSLSPSERFYASLLMTDILDLKLSHHSYHSNGNQSNNKKHKTNNDVQQHNSIGINQNKINKSQDLAGWKKVISKICERAGVPFPSKLPSTYQNAKEYYHMHASLVLEESRHIISDALIERQKKCQRRQPINNNHAHVRSSSMMNDQKRNVLTTHQKEDMDSMTMKLISVEQKKKQTILTFEKFYNKDVPFTKSELFNMKPGCIFELIAIEEKHIKQQYTHYHDHRVSVSNLLATVVPKSTLDLEFDREFSILSLKVFQTNISIQQLESIEKWSLYCLCSLISEQRQFEGCYRAPKVPFLPQLLGQKQSSHIRFIDSDDDDDDKDENTSATDHNLSSCEEEKKLEYIDLDNDRDISIHNVERSEPQSLFKLPNLNDTQRKAAHKFLKSPSSTLTLVQGPPGTGKTTFMVSVICHSFYNIEQNLSKRIENPNRMLVTAPTNKAITVLASRFLDVINGDTSFNIVMIGVEDKLLSDDHHNPKRRKDDDHLSISTLCPGLKSIFVYTWIQEVIDTYKSFRNKLYYDYGCKVSSMCNLRNVLSSARVVTKKLRKSIPHQSKVSGSISYASTFISCLENVINREEDPSFIDEMMPQVKSSLIFLISSLDSMSQFDVVQELLATADIIFCTLSSSGVSAMKQTKRVDVLMVDEAAAATEAEFVIPFHLNPSKCLVVGDPKQLPATIMSRVASDYGLDRSVLSRLMYGCHEDHIMLDIQYRMRPCISLFPSRMFYDGKLLNGKNVSNSQYKSNVNLNNDEPYTFVQIGGQEMQTSHGSYYNMDEAKVVVNIVKQYSQRCKDLTRTQNQINKWFTPDRIRIITFYQGQVLCLRRLLNENGLGAVMVATVDSSQGCEADMIIISFVRSNSRANNRSKTGFLQDERRLNVALTRAKYQLVCVGDVGTIGMSDVSTLNSLIDDARARHVIVSAESILQTWSLIDKNNTIGVQDVCNETLTRKLYKISSNRVTDDSKTEEENEECIDLTHDAEINTNKIEVIDLASDESEIEHGEVIDILKESRFYSNNENIEQTQSEVSSSYSDAEEDLDVENIEQTQSEVSPSYSGAEEDLDVENIEQTQSEVSSSYSDAEDDLDVENIEQTQSEVSPSYSDAEEDLDVENIKQTQSEELSSFSNTKDDLDVENNEQMQLNLTGTNPEFELRNNNCHTNQNTCTENVEEMSKYKAKINTLDRKLIVVDSDENDSEYALNDKDIRNYKKEIATLKRKLPFVDSNPKERKEMQLEIARLQKIIDS